MGNVREESRGGWGSKGLREEVERLREKEERQGGNERKGGKEERQGEKRKRLRGERGSESEMREQELKRTVRRRR